MDNNSSIKGGLGHIPSSSLSDITAQVAQGAQKVLTSVGLQGIEHTTGKGPQQSQTQATTAPKLQSPIAKVMTANSCGQAINMLATQQQQILDTEKLNQSAVTNIQGTSAVSKSATQNQIEQIQAQMTAQQNAGKSGQVAQTLSWVAIGVAAVVAVAGVAAAVFTGGSSLVIAGAVLSLMAVGVMAFMQTSAGQDTKTWMVNETTKVMQDPAFDKVMGDLVQTLTFGMVSADSASDWINDNAQQIAQVVVGLAILGTELAMMVTGVGLGKLGSKAAVKGVEAATKGISKVAQAASMVQTAGTAAGGAVGVASGINMAVGASWQYKATMQGADAAATQGLLNILNKITSSSGKFIEEIQKLLSALTNDMAAEIATYMETSGQISSNLSA